MLPLDIELILAYAVVDRVINASFTDLHINIIPKWDYVPIFLAGVCIHWIQSGWQGAFSSVMAAISFLSYILTLSALPSLLFGPSVYKHLGSGDAKLALACGAFWGWESIWILFVSFSLYTSVFDLLTFFAGLEIKNPLAVFKETVKEVRAEIYGGGREVCRAFAPYITVPFILALIIKYSLGVV